MLAAPHLPTVRWVNPDYKDFGPRLGFAYQAFPGTVIRGGYEIGYAYLFRFGGEGLPAHRRMTCPITQSQNKGPSS